MAVVIRPALREDVPQLLELGRHFYASSGCAAHGLRFDEGALADTCAQLATEGVLLVAERDGELIGAVGALAYPWYLDRSQTIAQEIWWWVEPHARNTGAGKALLDELEAWAKARGAAVVSMATPGEGGQDETVARLYRRWGYQYTETNWAKVL